MKTDVYQRITDQIVRELENGVRPWLKPWNAEHAAGRITRPLRGNGIPYQGINVLMLWSAAMENGYAAPVWMTYRQASELKANVRKGEHGSLVVYADKIIRTEADAATGEEAERAIPFMKGYTVFNVEHKMTPDHTTDLNLSMHSSTSVRMTTAMCRSLSVILTMEFKASSSDPWAAIAINFRCIVSSSLSGL
jgi:antirestriction protein ArdC